MNDLTDRQACSLRAIAEDGLGVAVNRGTARALERRGLAETVGDAVMTPGVTMRLTVAGAAVVLPMLVETRDRRAARGLRTSHWDRAIARLEALTNSNPPT